MLRRIRDLFRYGPWFVILEVLDDLVGMSLKYRKQK